MAQYVESAILRIENQASAEIERIRNDLRSLATTAREVASQLSAIGGGAGGIGGRGSVPSAGNVGQMMARQQEQFTTQQKALLNSQAQAARTNARDTEEANNSLRRRQYHGGVSTTMGYARGGIATASDTLHGLLTSIAVQSLEINATHVVVQGMMEGSAAREQFRQSGNTNEDVVRQTIQDLSTRFGSSSPDVRREFAEVTQFSPEGSVQRSLVTLLEEQKRSAQQRGEDTSQIDAGAMKIFKALDMMGLFKPDERGQINTRAIEDRYQSILQIQAREGRNLRPEDIKGFVQMSGPHQQLYDEEGFKRSMLMSTEVTGSRAGNYIAMMDRAIYGTTGSGFGKKTISSLYDAGFLTGDVVEGAHGREIQHARPVDQQRYNRDPIQYIADIGIRDIQQQGMNPRNAEDVNKFVMGLGIGNKSITSLIEQSINRNFEAQREMGTLPETRLAPEDIAGGATRNTADSLDRLKNSIISLGDALDASKAGQLFRDLVNSVTSSVTAINSLFGGGGGPGSLAAAGKGAATLGGIGAGGVGLAMAGRGVLNFFNPLNESAVALNGSAAALSAAAAKLGAAGAAEGAEGALGRAAGGAGGAAGLAGALSALGPAVAALSLAVAAPELNKAATGAGSAAHQGLMDAFNRVKEWLGVGGNSLSQAATNTTGAATETKQAATALNSAATGLTDASNLDQRLADQAHQLAQDTSRTQDAAATKTKEAADLAHQAATNQQQAGTALSTSATNLTNAATTHDAAATKTQQAADQAHQAATSQQQAGTALNTSATDLTNSATATKQAAENGARAQTDAGNALNTSAAKLTDASNLDQRVADQAAQLLGQQSTVATTEQKAADDAQTAATNQQQAGTALNASATNLTNAGTSMSNSLSDAAEKLKQSISQDMAGLEALGYGSGGGGGGSGGGGASGGWGSAGRYSDSAIGGLPSSIDDLTSAMQGATAGGPGVGRANFMHGQFGGVGQNLTTFMTPGGQSVRVNAAAASDMKGFVDAMAAAGAPLRDVAGFVNRTMRGSSHISQHAYGNAIDIDQHSRNVVDSSFQQWANSHRDVIKALGARYHMIDGGTWRNPDFGHFEWSPRGGRGGGGAGRYSDWAAATGGQVPNVATQNAGIAAVRKPILDQVLGDPRSRMDLYRMMKTESGSTGPNVVPTLESAVNRTLFMRQRHPGYSLEQMIHSGFYGPFNRGQAQRASISSTEAARFNEAIAKVAAGSNIIRGRNDQGDPGDPNVHGPGRVVIPGSHEIYNFWGGGGGHAASAKFAEYLNSLETHKSNTVAKTDQASNAIGNALSKGETTINKALHAATRGHERAKSDHADALHDALDAGGGKAAAKIAAAVSNVGVNVRQNQPAPSTGDTSPRNS